MIVPEIDMPGHTNAVIASYPELGDAPVEPYEGIEVGFSSLAIRSERTYEFIADALRELAEITPGPYLHLGGDESLATSDDDFQYFIARATASHIQALKACIRDEEAARKAGDMRRAIRLSGDFHLQIAEHAGHQTLGGILRELVSRTSLILMAYSAPHAQAREDATACGCQEHRGLIAAIQLRDAKEAARLMREHLERLESQLSFTSAPEAAPDLLELFGS